MSEIKKVAIAGVSGTLGPHVLKGLLEAKFEVTVLTRAQKSATDDPAVKVVEVDYESVESLKSALQGHDAVVSTINSTATEGQKVLIDAAIAVGVKRFIPSEFGSCTTSPKVQSLPLYAPMATIRHYLQEKAKANELSWTVLACGGFLEFLVNQPMMVDFDKHEAVLFDEGDNRISSNSLVSIGKAIAEILKKPEETKNRVLRISEVIVTQNNILKIAQEARPDIMWTTNKVKSSDLLKKGLDAVAGGDFSMPTIMNILAGTAFGGEEYGGAYDVTDNELLGVKALTEDQFKKLIVDRLA